MTDIKNALYFIVAVAVISNFNQAIKDFFSGNFVVFVTIALFVYEKNKNILVAIATAFFASIFVAVLTMPDPITHLKETFELIYPTTLTKPGCESIKVSDLISKFGDENALKKAMDESGVPNNLFLTDINAPEIATYIINNRRSPLLSSTCKI